MKQIAEERRQRFLSEYQDPYGPGLAKLMVQCGHILESIVGTEAVSEGFNALYAKLFNKTPEVNEPGLWFCSWEHIADVDSAAIPLSQRLARLHAEAFYGIALREDMSLGTWHEDHVACAHLYEFLEACPIDWWSGRPDLERLLAARSARHALDDPEDRRIWPAELAAISGLSLKTIKNLLAPSNSAGLRADADGTVGAREARAWLEARDNFLPSVWLDDASDASAPLAQDELQDEPIFVPVARDGTIFSPALKRAGRFTIGPKGSEEQFTEFRDALARLQQMANPTWRRPNEKGHWGIVSAVKWDRRTMTSLPMEGGA